MPRFKSQTATEYLILLAVVIVVALVVVNTLGVFPGIGSSSNKKISDQKLASDVVGVTSYFIGDSYSIFNLKNNNYDTITVTEFRINQQANLTCNSSNTIPALPAVLNIGQSVSINCSVVNSSSYPLSNRKTPIIGIMYTDSLGATRLAGNVLTYDAVSLSGGNGSGSSNTSNQTISGPVNGLVAYYSFDGNMSDVSGNGYNLNCTLGSCPSLNSSGVIGSAYIFGTYYLNTTNTTFLNNSNQISVSLWAYSRSTIGANLNKGLFSQTTSGGGSNVLKLCSSFTNSNALSFWINTAQLSTPANSFSIGQWHHVVATYLGGTGAVNIYIDGINTSISALGPTNNITQSEPFTIGTDMYDPVSRKWPGMIDEVRIYSRILNSSEVSELYNLGLANASRVLAMDFNSNGLNYLNLNYSNRSLYEQGRLIQDNSIYNNSGNSSGLTKQYWWNGNTNGTSVINGSLQFDGVNDYVTGNVVTTQTDNVTLSAWIYPTSYSYHGIALANGASNNGYSIMEHDNGVYNWALGLGGVAHYSSAFTVDLNTWQYITLVRENTTWYLYKNGIKSSALTTATPATPTTITRIGYDGGNGYFNGSIDDVIIWGRALNATEINTIYQVGLTGRTISANNTFGIYVYPSNSNLVSYWSFDNDNATIAFDSTGFNNGTYFNGVANNAGSGKINNGTYFNGINQSIIASSGTITYDGLYTVQTFKKNGVITFPNNVNVSVLIVAGGGSAGAAYFAQAASGGGGAGGLILSNINITSGTYNISVGDGGLAPQPVNPGSVGRNGKNSSAFSLVAIGGGGGGFGSNGLNGGSGGGAGSWNTYYGGNGMVGQGFNGGNSVAGWITAGGGGGAGGNGTAPLSNSVSGTGGPGINSSINGSLVCYAGGGTGGYAGSATCGGGLTYTSGTNGLGGGGGGAHGANAVGSGGSGIVIVRYLTTDVNATSTNRNNNFTVNSSSVWVRPSSTNVWEFDAYNGTTYFVNGRVGTPTFYPLYTAQSNVVVIGLNTNGVNYFNGSLDEVRIYNRTLTTSEIASMYDQQKLHLQFDEFTGSSTTDISLVNTTGTLTNYPTNALTAPIWNATGGVNGTGAYTFDGVDDRIVGPTISITTATTGYTVSAWVNPRALVENAEFVSGGSTSANPHLRLGNSGIPFFTCGGNAYNVSYSIPLNNWTMLTGVDDGRNTLLYANGILKSNVTGTGCTVTGIMFGMHGSIISPFNGSIDNVQIFNRALNATEVLALYNSP